MTSTVFATSNESDAGDDGNNGDWNESCKDSGYDDGQNHAFQVGTYDHCGDESGGDWAYYDGFIDGCMSVKAILEMCVNLRLMDKVFGIMENLRAKK